MKSCAIWTSLALFFAGAFALFLKMEWSMIGLIFIPIALWPLLVSWLMMGFCREKRPLILLLISAVLYFLWFGFVYAEIFYLNPDPQGSIALLFIGLYSIPVMLIFWITALVLEVNRRQKDQLAGSNPVESPTIPS